MTVTATVLLSLLATALAQSSTSSVQQALTATVVVSNSINSALPQTASGGPMGFAIPYVPIIINATESYWRAHLC
jgi:hypothetical protein